MSKSSLTSTLAHSDYLETRRFAVLDGLRAMSIIMVFTAHPASKEFWPLLHGATGVTMFFVLSGFLITTLLLREESRSGGVDLRAFYVRRTFRIYPMFFAVFFLYVFLLLVLGLQPERRAAFVENIPYTLLLFPEHMMFFNPYEYSIPFNGAWSIGIEEKFYLIWPVLGFVFLAKWKGARTPVLALLAAAFHAAGLLGPNLQFLSPYQHIVYGALVAVILHNPNGYFRASFVGRPRVLVLVVAATASLQFGTSGVLLEGWAYGLLGIFMAVLLTGLVTTRSSAVRWLSSKPMAYLASLSYVLYLIHNFFLNGAEELVPTYWGFTGSVVSTLTAFIASVLVAHVIHKYFEEPMRVLGVKLSRNLRRKEDTPRLKPLHSSIHS